MIDVDKYINDSKKILEYFESLLVMDKIIGGEEKIIIRTNDKNPIMFEIVFRENENYLVINNDSLKFKFIYVFESCLGFCGMTTSEHKIFLETFCKYNMNLDFLDIEKIDMWFNISNMSNSARLEGNINDVDIDKIILMRERLDDFFENG